MDDRFAYPYKCHLCNFKTKIKTHYMSHINTGKHKRLQKEYDDMVNIKDEREIATDSTLRSMIENMNTKLNYLLESNKNKDKLIEKQDILLKQQEKSILKQNERIIALENALNVSGETGTPNAPGGVHISGVSGNISMNIDQSTHNTVNIQINPFGKENWDYLTNEEVITIMKGVNECVPELVKRLHFDNNHPENRNVKISNKKLPTIETFDGVRWEAKPKIKTIDGWIKDTVDKLDNEYGDEFKQQASEFLSDLWTKKYGALMNEGDKDHSKVIREVRKSVEYTILNNRDLDKSSKEIR